MPGKCISRDLGDMIKFHQKDFGSKKTLAKLIMKLKTVESIIKEFKKLGTDSHFLLSC